MDITLLYKERKFVNHQFPTVTALNDPPTMYEGMLRCETGKVKELAKEEIWPFTEYVEWHNFRLALPEEYPLKPPLVTWLTKISHPNIVTQIPGAVCVSILGETWRPDLKIVSVINALYYLLADPNPNNVFDDPKCLEVAKICKKHGFPLYKIDEKEGKEEKEEGADTFRFNIVPIPQTSSIESPAQLDDIVRFRVREE
jgi:hypothetical protein